MLSETRNSLELDQSAALAEIDILEVIPGSAWQTLKFHCGPISLQASFVSPSLVSPGKYLARLRILAQEILLYEYPHPFELLTLEENQLAFKGRIDSMVKTNGRVTVQWHFDAIPFCIQLASDQQTLMGQGDFIEGQGALEVIELTAL